VIICEAWRRTDLGVSSESRTDRYRTPAGPALQPGEALVCSTGSGAAFGCLAGSASAAVIVSLRPDPDGERTRHRRCEPERQYPYHIAGSDSDNGPVAALSPRSPNTRVRLRPPEPLLARPAECRYSSGCSCIASSPPVPSSTNSISAIVPGGCHAVGSNVERNHGL
jgi:hypothetical protein